MQLSKKQEKFSEIFIGFLKSILNFEHLPKKMTLIAYVFPQIPVPKNMVRQMVKKLCFRGSLDRQRGKCIERLLESV